MKNSKLEKTIDEFYRSLKETDKNEKFFVGIEDTLKSQISELKIEIRIQEQRELNNTAIKLSIFTPTLLDKKESLKRMEVQLENLIKQRQQTKDSIKFIDAQRKSRMEVSFYTILFFLFVIFLIYIIARS